MKSCNELAAATTPLPHPLMPEEMILRASSYASTGEVVHLTLESKDGFWAVFGSGVTLGEAAAELFMLVDRSGGLVACRDKLFSNARANGIQVVADPQSQLPGVSE